MIFSLSAFLCVHAFSSIYLSMKDMGAMLILFGAVLLIIGILFYLDGGISWLGKLPGDIRIERPGFSFYFPITTGILISIVVSLVIFIVRMFR